MSADFTVIGARARGLQTRFFTRRELEDLAALDRVTLGRTLARSPRFVEAPPEAATAFELEQATRRTAARHLALLARWTEPLSPALELFFADQDRRNLRALLRGAIQGAPAADRLAATVPTPSLPNRALLELAHLPTPADVVGLLVVLSHPDARRLLPHATRTGAELLELELALDQGFAERALAAARRGDDPLRGYVARRLDVTNAQRALLLAGEVRDVDAERLFVEGGQALAREAFLEVATAKPALAGAALTKALAGTALEELAAAALGDPVRLEALWLRSELDAQRAAARLDPLGSATVMRVLLRLLAQSLDLRRLVLGAAAGAPASTLRPGLVTPWS